MGVCGEPGIRIRGADAFEARDGLYLRMNNFCYMVAAGAEGRIVRHGRADCMPDRKEANQ